MKQEALKPIGTEYDVTHIEWDSTEANPKVTTTWRVINHHLVDNGFGGQTWAEEIKAIKAKRSPLTFADWKEAYESNST